jgi:hypothetical protein
MGWTEDVEDQLFDELMGRFWALQLGVPSPACESVAHYRAVARLSLERLRCGQLSADAIVGALFPLLSPGAGDAWWTTPLGQLVAAGLQRARGTTQPVAISTAA